MYINPVYSILSASHIAAYRGFTEASGAHLYLRRNSRVSPQKRLVYRRPDLSVFFCCAFPLLTPTVVEATERGESEDVIGMQFLLSIGLLVMQVRFPDESSTVQRREAAARRSGAVSPFPAHQHITWMQDHNGESFSLPPPPPPPPPPPIRSF